MSDITNSDSKIKNARVAVSETSAVMPRKANSAPMIAMTKITTAYSIGNASSHHRAEFDHGTRVRSDQTQQRHCGPSVPLRKHHASDREYHRRGHIARVARGNC